MEELGEKERVKWKGMEGEREGVKEERIKGSKKREEIGSEID